MKRHNVYKITSLIMSLIFIISAFPVVIFADQITSENSEPVIVAEDTSKRSEYEKHYICSDGTMQAVMYDMSVHYMDDKGEWQDINNSLVYDSKEKAYINSFNPSFNSVFYDDGNISLGNGDNKISWKTIASGNSVEKASQLSDYTHENTTVLNPGSVDPKGKKVTSESVFSLKAGSGIKYDKKSAEYALDYSLSQGKVKENVIIYNKKSGIDRVVCQYTVSGLYCRLLDDNSLIFVNENGETVYNVSSPYVYDSCGDTLEKITVDLFDTRDGYTVVYKMDKEWLSANDRVYPVVFDPAIYTDEFQPSMIDTTYIQGEAPDYSSSYAIHFGAENYYFSSIEYRYSKYHGYIKFTSLPEIMNSGIISAKLNYTVLKNSQLIESRKPTLFKLAEPWRATNESSTAPYLYRSEPQRLYGEGNEVIGENINGQLSFDITQWFSSIYSGEYTYGFMLGYNEDRPGGNLNSTTINDVISIASCDNSVTANRPSLVVNYRINSPIITIKNKASGKFLNVSRINVSSNEMKGNVDQWTEDDTIGEAFRLETDPLTGYCRLYAFYNNYGLGYVVSRSSSSDNIITDDYSDNLSNWKIVDAGNGYYYFKSATDDNKYMTAHDSNNGSYSGTSNTSAGNVFLSSNKDDYAKWSINIVGDDNLITPMDVPLHLQETNITCSSACIRMLTHYYGKNYSESEITAMQKDENDSKWEYVYVVKNVINSATNDDLINYSFVDVSERISFNYKVYKSLANGRPVIINVTPKLPSYTCYSTTSDSGHYIVICGIVMQNNELCYIIKDPHYRYGDTYILSVENTYNSLTHHYIIGQWN